jgi:hypothetical protein
VVAPWLRSQKRIAPVKPNTPRLVGVGRNSGMDLG